MNTISKNDKCIISIKSSEGKVKNKIGVIHNISSKSNELILRVNFWKKYDVKFVRIDMNDIINIYKIGKSKSVLEITEDNTTILELKSYKHKSLYLKENESYTLYIKNNITNEYERKEIRVISLHCSTENHIVIVDLTDRFQCKQLISVYDISAIL